MVKIARSVDVRRRGAQVHEGHLPGWQLSDEVAQSLVSGDAERRPVERARQYQGYGGPARYAAGNHAPTRPAPARDQAGHIPSLQLCQVDRQQ